MKIALALIILFLSGCTQIIYNDPNGVEVKVNTLFKDINFDEFQYGDIYMGKYTGKSKNIKAITPYGVAETSD